MTEEFVAGLTNVSADTSPSATQVSHEGACHPLTGQFVRIVGRPGVYVVLRADSATGTADVLLMSSIRQIESGIPLGTLNLLSETQRAGRVRASELPAAG